MTFLHVPKLLYIANEVSIHYLIGDIKLDASHSTVTSVQDGVPNAFKFL